MLTVTLRGGPEVVAALRGLSDTRELSAANPTAARIMRDAGRGLIRSRSGTLAASVADASNEDGFRVGSDSRYARWFHVPFLSQGAVKYAKKVSRRGNPFGQRIPYNPFLISAARSTEAAVVDQYVRAVGALIDRAWAGVPRG